MDDDIVVSLDAVIACLGNGDVAALDIDNAFVVYYRALIFTFVALDAVAVGRCDGNVSVFDIHDALALQTVICGGHVDCRGTAEAQVVAGVNAVVVVALHD